MIMFMRFVICFPKDVLPNNPELLEVNFLVITQVWEVDALLLKGIEGRSKTDRLSYGPEISNVLDPMYLLN